MRVELVDHMGSDLTVVNAARVSFNKHKETLDESDAKLIGYLAKNGHWSPFSHAQVQLRVEAPFFVANQLKRSTVGFAINEVSRRYVDDDPKFLRNVEWRGRPPGSIKQGSGGRLPLTDQVDLGVSHVTFLDVVERQYHLLIARGVAPEQARMVLPLCTYTSWYWTGSLYAWARLYLQRIDPHAQLEAQQFATQVGNVVGTLFPISWASLTKRELDEAQA
jgi:thymidylate synthase (FAD)